MRPFGSLTRWRSPLAGAVVLGAVGAATLAGLAFELLHGAESRTRATQQAALRDEGARRELRRVLAEFDATESAGRGYLLTDDANLLAPMRNARRELYQTFAAVAANPRWSVPGRAALRDLTSLVDEQIAGLDHALALHDAGERDSAAAAVRAGADSALGERMRALVAAMNEDLVAQTEADTGDQRSAEIAALSVALGGSIFATMALVAAAAMLLTQMRVRRARDAGLLAGQEAAQHSDRVKSRFLAAVSHDLRQPLHAITLFVAALRHRSAGKEVDAIVDNIGIAADAMQRMVTALLDVARLGAGAVAAQPRSFALEDVLHTLRSKFVPLAAAKGIALEVPDSDLKLWMDPALLESMLGNLLANAVAYTAQGSVSMTAWRREQELEIAVRDTGPGIAADQCERIFQEFVQLGEANPASHSVGLGLAIVRMLAELLGGHVTVDSTPGVGSVFTVRVPFIAGALEPPAAAAADEPADGLAGLRILLLDDDPLVLRATATVVADWGATPVAVLSVAEAMAALERMAPDAPDAAIIDQDIIGDLSGAALLDRIAARFGVALPSVVLTGMTSAGMREELNESGHPWLLKPAGPDVLRRTLARAVAARHPTARQWSDPDAHYPNVG